MLAPCQRADSRPPVPVSGLTLAEVLRAGLPAYARAHRLPAHHWRAINAITACRSGLLGGREYQCAYCHRAHFVPHSCGNRHCPTCQWANSQTWLQAQAQIVLPIPYFHVVFTLPHQLNALMQQNQQVLYDLLFASVSQTLLSFGRNNLGAQLGLTAVLHTWSQTLTDHYHLHCIVTGGGVSLDGQHWIPSQGKYLFNITALSRVFQGKFCAGLQELYVQGRLQFHGQLWSLSQAANFQALVRQATVKNWVVYSKRPFAGPEQVLAYLSRYTHRVGITNGRLLQLDPQAQTLTFDYKDYADGARHKQMTLSLQEFIRRLRLHILPPRFVKIRHYGLLANRGRQQRLERARALLGASVAEQPQLALPVKPGTTLLICPHCGWRTLVLVRDIRPPRKSPKAKAVADTS